MTIHTKFDIGQEVYDSGRKRSFTVGEIHVNVWDTERAALPDLRYQLTEYRSSLVDDTHPSQHRVVHGPWVAERYLEGRP